VSRLADAGDAPVLDPDVGLDDARPVDDQRVGDHAVQGGGLAGAGHLPHPVAQHLAAAELALVPVDGVVALDLGDQVRVAETHPVPAGRAEKVGVVAPIDGAAHGISSSCAKPLASATASAWARPNSVTGPSESAFPPRATRPPA